MRPGAVTPPVAGRPPAARPHAARVRAGRAVVAVLALALALAAGGCGDQRGDLVLAVGGAPAELAVWQEMATAYGESTGVRVELLRQPSDTAQQRQGLIVALSAGRPDPDVFLLDVAWIALFAAADWLRPLPAAAADTTAFFPGILDAVDRHGGDLVALPVYLDVGLLYWREDLLRAHGLGGPPRTWDRLEEMAATVQAAERRENPRFRGFVWQGAQYEGLVVNFLEFAGTAGGLRRTAVGWQVDTPANRRALQRMHALVHTRRLSPAATSTEMREEEVRAFFQRGDALFERNWPYAWPLHQRPGSPVRGRVGVGRLPGPTPDTGAGTLGGWHVGVSRFSDAPGQAVRFVRWLTSRAVQERMVRRLGWNPGRRDLYDDPDLARELPHLPHLKAALRTARPRPPVPWYPQMSRVLQRHLGAALCGRATAADALAAAEEEIAALARYYAAPESGPAGRDRGPAGPAAMEVDHGR
jgi:multiple sugar transport system substrate-binding protein